MVPAAFHCRGHDCTPPARLPALVGRPVRAPSADGREVSACGAPALQAGRLQGPGSDHCASRGPGTPRPARPRDWPPQLGVWAGDWGRRAGSSQHLRGEGRGVSGARSLLRSQKWFRQMLVLWPQPGPWTLPPGVAPEAGPPRLADPETALATLTWRSAPEKRAGGRKDLVTVPLPPPVRGN